MSTAFLNRLAAPTPAPSAVLTFGDMLAAHVSAVDGLYATTLQECRMVIGPATYGVAAQTFNASRGDVASSDYLLARSGGLRSTALIPEPDSTNKRQHGIVHGIGGVNRAYRPSLVGHPVNQGRLHFCRKRRGVNHRSFDVGFRD